jgi:hypothetical protein
MRRSPEQSRPPEKEQTSIQRLWSEYGFSGIAPLEGSPVEQRLEIMCKRYVELNVQLRKKQLSKSEVDRREALVHYTGSESERRALHNKIAIATVGENRSSMSNAEAARIADFAAKLTHNGLSMLEVLELEQFAEEHQDEFRNEKS